MRNSTLQRIKGNLSSSILFSSLFILCLSVNGQEENPRAWDVVKTSPSVKSSVIQAAVYTSSEVSSSAILQVKKLEDKVLISWTGSDEGNISHYILELSSNGKEYRQAAVFFTGDESSETMTYKFSEKLKKNEKLKYRLKVVGKDGEMVVRY